jgi:hypothetical protein
MGCIKIQIPTRVRLRVPATGRRMQELAAIPVERRPIDLYAELAEVAR